MYNKEIREEIKKANLKLWQVAELLGIRDNEFSKKLRKELTCEEKENIRKLIASNK